MQANDIARLEKIKREHTLLEREKTALHDHQHVETSLPGERLTRQVAAGEVEQSLRDNFAHEN